MSYEQLKLDNQLCFRIYTVSRLITQAYEPYLKPLGITYTQYIVLMVLWEKDEQPVNDIAKRLLLGINTISPLIKRMEVLGLLSRKESEIDKRRQIVCLTEEGKKLKRKAANIPMCMADKLDACHIDTGKLAAMIPLLDELIEKLQGKAE